MIKKPKDKTRPKWRWILLAVAIILSVYGQAADFYDLIVEYNYPIIYALVINSLAGLVSFGIIYWVVMGPLLYVPVA